jgi:hypothetical protein
MKRFLLGLLIGFTLSTPAQYSPNSGRMPQAVVVPFSATPTFNAASGSTFLITLTGNVTSSTFSNAMNGMVYTFHICQDSSGLHSFAWPVNVKATGLIVIPATALASTCATQQVVWNAALSNAYPAALGLLNQ